MKKKILFTIESLGGGGAEKVLLTIINGLDREKYDISLYLIFSGGIYEKNLKDDIKLSSVFKDITTLNFLSRPIYKIFRSIIIRILVKYPPFIKYFTKIDKTYDIGISFCEGLNAAILMENSYNFKRKIGWIHIDFNYHKANIANKYIRYYYNQLDQIVFVSKEAKKSFQKIFPSIDQSKLQVIYNPIDKNDIIKKSNEKSFIKNKFTIISVGRFVQQKRFDRVIKIAKLFKDEKMNIQFLIIGTGPLENYYQKLISDFNLSDYVYLIPFQSNVVAWIKNADLYLLTSDYEGLPVVICEAMILDKPIVATKITGTTELLENGKYGLLTEKTIESIYIALKEMIENKNLRQCYINRLIENKDNYIFRYDLKDFERFLEDD